MLLNENFLVNCVITESDRTKLPKGVLCRGVWPICNVDQINANGRIYERAVYENVIANEDYQNKIKCRSLYGHGEHPEGVKSDLMLTSHIITDTFFEAVEENNKILEKVFQGIDILDTPHGRLVNTLIEAGCLVGVSTRASGDIETISESSGSSYDRVIPDKYKYITTDFTADPSTFGTVPAKMQHNVVEAVGTGYKYPDNASRISRELAEGILRLIDTDEAKTLLETIVATPSCKEFTGNCCTSCKECKCKDKSISESEDLLELNTKRVDHPGDERPGWEFEKESRIKTYKLEASDPDVLDFLSKQKFKGLKITIDKANWSAKIETPWRIETAFAILTSGPGAIPDNFNRDWELLPDDSVDEAIKNAMQEAIVEIYDMSSVGDETPTLLGVTSISDDIFKANETVLLNHLKDKGILSTDLNNSQYLVTRMEESDGIEIGLLHTGQTLVKITEAVEDEDEDEELVNLEDPSKLEPALSDLVPGLNDETGTDLVNNSADYGGNDTNFEPAFTADDFIELGELAEESEEEIEDVLEQGPPDPPTEKELEDVPDTPADPDVVTPEDGVGNVVTEKVKPGVHKDLRQVDPEEVEEAFNAYMETKSKQAQCPAGTNQKTGIAFDFTDVCYFREQGTPCDYCYVEQSREAGKVYIRNLMSKGNLSLQQVMDIINTGKWVNKPNKNYKTAIKGGITKNKKFYGMGPNQPPKFVKDRPYVPGYINSSRKGFKPEDVKRMNAQGGVRLYAKSDYLEKHDQYISDMIKDANAIGLKIKAITKRPEFVDKWSDKINVTHLSVDEAAKYGNHSNSLSIEEAYKIAQKHPKGKVILRSVAFTPEEAIEHAKDSRIGIVTPYHGKGKEFQDKEGDLKNQFVNMLNKKHNQGYIKLMDLMKSEKLTDDQLHKFCCQTGKCKTCEIHCAGAKRGAIPGAKKDKDVKKKRKNNESISTKITERKDKWHKEDNITFKLVREKEWDEWLTKAYVNGKYNEELTGHYDDKEDAMNSLKAEKKWADNLPSKNESKNDSTLQKPLVLEHKTCLCKANLLESTNCNYKHVSINGKVYERTMKVKPKVKCSSCLVEMKSGNNHHVGCMMEACPACGHSITECECTISGYLNAPEGIKIHESAPSLVVGTIKESYYGILDHLTKIAEDEAYAEIYKKKEGASKDLTEAVVTVGVADGMTASVVTVNTDDGVNVAVDTADLSAPAEMPMEAEMPPAMEEPVVDDNIMVAPDEEALGNIDEVDAIAGVEEIDDDDDLLPKPTYNERADIAVKNEELRVLSENFDRLVIECNELKNSLISRNSKLRQLQSEFTVSERKHNFEMQQLKSNTIKVVGKLKESVTDTIREGVLSGYLAVRAELTGTIVTEAIAKRAKTAKTKRDIDNILEESRKKFILDIFDRPGYNELVIEKASDGKEISSDRKSINEAVTNILSGVA